jgi:HEPN domain-containing protein
VPAQSRLTKAGDDLAIADLVLNSEIGVEWAARFHAQQAAEKAVKAVLVHLGIDFPKSHRLDLLAGLLPASIDVGFDIDALADLAPAIEALLDSAAPSTTRNTSVEIRPRIDPAIRRVLRCGQRSHGERLGGCARRCPS